MKKLILFFFIPLTFLPDYTSAQSGQTKVLFIGNSFTYVNNMPGMFNAMCQAAGKNVYVDSYTAGGQYVDYFVNSPTTYSYLHSQNWDYVIYQDNQGYYIWYPGTGIPAQVIADNQRLQDSIKAINPCSKVIYFAGWAFQGGIPQYITNDNSVWETQRVLQNYRYMNSLPGFNNIIAPIGRGWISALNERPDITLWNTDGAHPAPAGTYIGANVIYTTIFGENPLGNSYNPGFTTADLDYMQSISYHAVVDSMALNNLSTYMPAVTASSGVLNSIGTYASYQWLNNNSVIGSATNNSYTLSSPGTEKYQLEITDDKGCKSHSLNFPYRDAEIHKIISPSDIGCLTTLSPSVTIFNGGWDALQTLNIDEQIDGGGTTTTNWSGLLAPLSYSITSLNSLTTTTGAHTFTASSWNPNNGIDGNAFNNYQTRSFNILGASIPLPFTEGFENPSFAAANGWSINNPDASITWAQTITAAYSGSASIFMDNRNYTLNGPTDDLITPALDLTTQLNPMLTFEVAYQLYSDPGGSQTWSDTLEVLASTNCGADYTSVYKKSGTNLVTVSPAFSTTAFVPTSQSQWRQESVSLNSFASSNNVIVKFKHTADYENNMYIDDVTISGLTSVKNSSISEGAVDIYPNPAHSIIYINASTETMADRMDIYNSIGGLVKSVLLSSVDRKLDVSEFPKGFYSFLVKNSAGKIIQNKKIVLE